MRPAHLTYGILGLLAIPLAIGVGVDTYRPDYHLEDAIGGESALRALLVNLGDATSVALTITDASGATVGEGWMELPAATTVPATVFVAPGSYHTTLLLKGGMWPFGYRIENEGDAATCQPGVVEARFEIRVDSEAAGVAGPFVSCQST